MHLNVIIVKKGQKWIDDFFSFVYITDITLNPYFRFSKMPFLKGFLALFLIVLVGFRGKVANSLKNEKEASKNGKGMDTFVMIYT